MTYQDPYLEKRRREEQQILAQLKASGAVKVPPEIGVPDAIGTGIMAGFGEKMAKSIDDYITAELFQKQDYSGLFLPSSASAWAGTTFTTASGATGWKKNLTVEDIVANCKEFSAKANDEAWEMLGYPTDRDYRGAPTEAEECLQRKIDGRILGSHSRASHHRRTQALLNKHNGRRDEYVHSPTLKCHVRIGESLKPKAR